MRALHSLRLIAFSFYLLQLRHPLSAHRNIGWWQWAARFDLRAQTHRVRRTADSVDGFRHRSTSKPVTTTRHYVISTRHTGTRVSLINWSSAWGSLALTHTSSVKHAPTAAAIVAVEITVSVLKQLISMKYSLQLYIYINHTQRWELNCRPHAPGTWPPFYPPRRAQAPSHRHKCPCELTALSTWCQTLRSWRLGSALNDRQVLNGTWPACCV